MTTLAFLNSLFAVSMEIDGHLNRLNDETIYYLNGLVYGIHNPKNVRQIAKILKGIYYPETLNK